MEDKKIIELLNDLSLDEKIGQLLQLNGSFFEGDGLATGPMQDMNLSEEQVRNTGSVLSVVGAKNIRKMQESYMKNQPHGIPMIFMADVINGYRTVFPIPLAQGCSFNTELVKEMARISAKESARAGIHVTFSPMVDLVRDCRWGRVMESTGEDVYLNGEFAKAIVEGYQGDSIGEKDRVSACIKHFAGYGAPVAGRDYNQVELSERSLKEDYLPAYKKGVDAGARMVMTSFNTLGRIPSTGNKELMKGILRDEWGFDGILISDWAAIQELVFQGVAKDAKEAAKLSINATVDIDMMTNCYVNNLKKLIEEGTVSVELIDECVLRILRFKNELGLFENPYKDADEAFDEMDDIAPEHMSFARKAAPETFVLLKNDGILPLSNKPTDECRKIAFIGPYVDEKRVCGSWSLFFNEKENVTIKEALCNKELEVEYSLSKGTTTLAPNETFYGFSGPYTEEKTDEELKAMLKEALNNAKDSDVVVMTIGENHQMTGEGGSRTEITIPEHQLELFRKVYEVNKNIVVVNFSGRPLDLREIDKKSRALLQVWFPGTVTGDAVLDVLFGDVNPSGRLSMSFPYNVGQVPVYYSEFHTGRIYTGDNNRFCSRYIDAPNRPLYVFGHGLDYTDYAYDNLKISNNTLTKDGSISVTVDVTNTGKRDGNEVIQMYIQDMVGSVTRPLRELKGFKKIKIEKGKTEHVTFEINADMLKFYNDKMEFTSEEGEFKVYVGHDSEAKLEATFNLV